MEDRKPAEIDRPRELLKLVGGRDELNLAEFPITVLSDRVPEGMKTLVFEDEVFDQQAGEMVKRRLTITGSDAYGLPTAVDDEILVALIQLTKLSNGFSNRQVHFTRYELLKLLGWNDEGRNYERIEESLNRWVGVTFFYDNAWWNREAKSWVSEKFHLLDNVSLLDRDERRRFKVRKQQEFAFSSFRWNEVIFQSFQADNLKRLNVDLYFALESSISKRMYRFLDKRFFHRRRWEFDLKEFAFEHIGLSRSYADAGKIKEKLQPAFDELTAAGFLEPMSREQRYTKLSRGKWRVAVVQRARPIEAVTEAGETSELERALVSRGVTPATARELVERHPAEHVQARIEAFDWLVTKKDRKVTKSPAGYLVKSIADSYSPPKGFESKADRDHRAAAEDAKRRKVEESKKRAEAEQQAREKAEQKRIADYLKSLTADEREALEAEAFANANPFFLNQYRRAKGNPSSEAMYRKLIVDTHVTGILEAQGTGH
jgi:hypothetical protein